MKPDVKLAKEISFAKNLNSPLSFEMLNDQWF